MSIRNQLISDINSEIDKQENLPTNKNISVQIIKSANEALVDAFLGLQCGSHPNERRAIEAFLSSLERITKKYQVKS